MPEVGTAIRIDDVDLHADGLDPREAAALYEEHGCFVVRGLMTRYVDALLRDVELDVAQSMALLDRAVETSSFCRTPNGTIVLPAPEGFGREKQLMVLSLTYTTSAALLRSALDDTVLDLAEEILGPNIELFGNGQCHYKESRGGHPKNLHQDSAYFEHRYVGPVGILFYLTDTSLEHGPLQVVPGSHRRGQLAHVDTFSHLALKEDEWPWESALPIPGNAGDTIFFHEACVHGSQENCSETPRPVIIHRYRRPDDYAVLQAWTEELRAEGERHAHETRKTQADAGFMVRGFRVHVAADDEADR